MLGRSKLSLPKNQRFFWKRWWKTGIIEAISCLLSSAELKVEKCVLTNNDWLQIRTTLVGLIITNALWSLKFIGNKARNDNANMHINNKLLHGVVYHWWNSRKSTAVFMFITSYYYSGNLSGPMHQDRYVKIIIIYNLLEV